MFRPDPLPVPVLDPDPRAVLARLLSVKVLEPARSIGLELVTIGCTAVPPTGHQVCWTDFDAWLFTASADDPTSKAYGGKIPIPGAARQHLERLADAGVAPDLIWLAHQLPPAWLSGDPIPDLVPAPAHLRRFDDVLMLPVRGIKKIPGLIATATDALGLGFLAILAALSETTYDGLDPVVLAGVKHPGLPVAQWAVLARWDWD